MTAKTKKARKKKAARKKAGKKNLAAVRKRLAGAQPQSGFHRPLGSIRGWLSEHTEAHTLLIEWGRMKRAGETSLSSEDVAEILRDDYGFPFAESRHLLKYAR